MPNFFESLLDRILHRDHEAPEAAETERATSRTRDSLRGLNYEDGRDRLRPEREPAPRPRTGVPQPTTDGQTQIELPKGKEIVLKASDVKYSADATWEHLADLHGMIGWRLAQANEGVAPVEGAKIYLPSPEELLYADCMRVEGDPQKAAARYEKVSEAGGLSVLKGAREAASGDSGESYGTAGKNGAFYASNPKLAGASKKRTTMHAGKKVYKVVWASDFWKCNLFANESVYRGGFEPSMKANGHYTTAGSLYKDTKSFTEISASSAYAGLVTVFQGGAGSNESHTGVLGSMPIISTDADGNTVVEFTFIAASSDRAREQDKKVTLKKGTNEIIDGDYHDKLRFLKPLKKQAN